MHATIASMLRGQKVIVAILVSAREHADTEIEALVTRVSNAGGEVVGRVVQRRGVSRSKKPGGARRMSAPMARDTYIGHGKAKELAAMCAAKQASVVVFANELDDRQRETLGALTGAKVIDGREL